MIDNVTTEQPGDGTISVLLHNLRQDVLSLIVLSGKSIAPVGGKGCLVLCVTGDIILPLTMPLDNPLRSLGPFSGLARCQG